ncbi:hypothetical protein ACFSHQ_01935 [Gemmobacter lanyuensis]
MTWLDLQPALRSSCAEVVSSEGQTLSTALVTAELAPAPAGTDLRVTVQLASVGQDMQAGYREGFEAGVTGLAQVAERSMVIQRRIRAPRHLVWGPGSIRNGCRNGGDRTGFPAGQRGSTCAAGANGFLT